MTTESSDTSKSAELAQLFHEAYERLAPQYGYFTRPETRAFDPSSPNGKTMIAVCEEILAAWNRRASVSAWMPIESAPKDGRRVWIYERLPVKIMSVARWVGHPHSAWIADSGGHLRRATHWMPLPPPPAAIDAAMSPPSPSSDTGEKLDE